MTRPEILDRIREAAAMLGGDAMKTLQPESDLRGLGLDSMDLVEVVSVLEDAFGVRLPDEALGDVKTADELVTTIERAIAAEKA